MKAFQVLINGEEKCVAGVGEFGDLRAMIAYTHPHPAALKQTSAPPHLIEAMAMEQLYLTIMGIVGNIADTQIHDVAWSFQTLQVGDSVEFRIVEVTEASPPGWEQMRDQITPEEKSQTERRALYEELKREFE